MITEHIKAHNYRDHRTLSSIKLELFGKLTKIITKMILKQYLLSV